jgi:hypothetical protein
MSQPPRDPVIEEIREVRHRISERFGHDPERLFQHYLELQEEYRDQWLDTSGTADQVAPNPPVRARKSR